MSLSAGSISAVLIGKWEAGDKYFNSVSSATAMPVSLFSNSVCLTYNLSEEIIQQDVMVPAKQPLIWSSQVCEEPE